MLKSETIGKLAEALAKAQGQFQPIEKNRTVTVTGTTSKGKDYQYDFDYADLDGIIAATRRALADNGLAVMQLLGDGADGKTATLTTILTHSSGEWISTEISFDKQDGEDAKSMQAFGGDVTYIRRYQRGAFLDVSAETDDDGGMTRGMESKQSKAREAKPEEEFEFAISKRETTGTYGKPEEYWKRWEDAIFSGKAEKITKTTKTGKPLPAWRMKIDVTPVKVDTEKAAAPNAHPSDVTPLSSDAPKAAAAPKTKAIAPDVDDAQLKLLEAKTMAILITLFNSFPQEWKRPDSKLYALFMKRRAELTPPPAKGKKAQPFTSPDDDANLMRAQAGAQ